jgi:hypothetical protein
MADLFSASYFSTYDNAGTGIVKAGSNNKKLIGDGASGVGPYTRFGTRQLTAISVTSAAVNFTTTPAASGSNLSLAVNALQGFGEVFYVGKPTASGSNVFVALIALNTANAGGQGAGAFGGTADSTNIEKLDESDNAATFESIETVVSLALGQAVTDITVGSVELTGLTFA